MMLALGVVGAYGALCIAARLWYPRALFPAPQSSIVTKDLEEKLVTLPQKDGSSTKALYFAPPKDDARTVVVFHGNAETIFDEVWLAEELVRRGFGALLVEYRGYGVTYGPPPSEAMVYEDGEAALGWLADKGLSKERIALCGMSLGTAIAVEMAHRGHGSKLVLFSPFTSMIEMGKVIAPILPVSLLMAHRFESIAKAPKIAQSTLVIHGDQDEVIPFAMGEAIGKAIPGARFVRVASAHHNDLFVRERSGAPSASEILDLVTQHLTAP